MFSFIKNESVSIFRKCISLVIVITFMFTSIITPANAQTIGVLNLPAVGAMITQSPVFAPVLLKGMKVASENPFAFDFILDSGNTELAQKELKQEANKLIKYFLASLTIPEEDLWVNLSPYEKDRIIPNEFGATEMGRDLLAQDYILKQLTASMIYPEKELGREFWDKVYARTYQLYGVSEISVNSFNKVWIVPSKAVVYEKNNIAYIVDSHLKVMTDVDYIAQHNNQRGREIEINESEDKSRITSKIIKEIIIPEIEKEINNGENFVKLRQIYHSLILAKWYKERLKTSILNQRYSDQRKVNGIDVRDKDIKEKIYQEYLNAFKEGVFNYIKEEYDVQSQSMVPRKYFSGGMNMKAPLEISTDFAMLSRALEDASLIRVEGFYNNKVEDELAVEEIEPDVDFAMMGDPVGGLVDDSSIEDSKVPAKTLNHYTSTTKRVMKRVMKDLLMEKNVLMVGERGTGKNSIIYELAHRLNQPIEVLSMNEDTTTRDLTERMILVDGKTEWVPSAVVEAIKNGRWLVLDEIDRAPPGVLSVLNNLLQFKEITLRSGERIRAGDGFRVVALMNPPTSAYAGGELSSELEDRFLIHYIDYLPEKEEVEYLKSIGPDVDTETIVNLVRAANDLREDYRNGNIPKPFSTRGLVNVVEHLNEYPEDPVYGELFRVFNLKYLSDEYHETVNKVFKTYDLMRSNVEIAPWEDIVMEEETFEMEEEDFTPKEEDIEWEEEDIEWEEEDIEWDDARDGKLTITELEKTLKGHTDNVRSLTMHDGKLVSGSSDKTIRVWDIEKGKVKVLKGHTGLVTTLLTRKGKLASGSDDKTIRVWDIEKGKVKVLKGHTNWVRSFTTHNGKLVSGGDDYTIRVWDIEEGKVKVLKGHEGYVATLTTHDGKLVSGSWDNTIRMWDIEKGKVKVLKGHTDWIEALTTHDGKLVSGSKDHTIRAWDIEKGKVKALRGHTKPIRSLATHEGKIVSGSRDNTIRVWDIEKGKVKVLKGHMEHVFALTTHDGKLISGSADKTIRVWDLDEDNLEELKLKAMLEGDLSEVFIDDDGQGNLDIGGIKVKIVDSAMASVTGDRDPLQGGEGQDKPLSISVRVLSNLARILSHQNIVLKEWEPITPEDITNPRPTWRVFKDGNVRTMHYVKDDLRGKDEDIPLAITGHEIFHLLFTDDDSWEKAVKGIEEKDLQSSFQWLMNAHEDPRVNNEGLDRFRGLKNPLKKLYEKFYPTKFKDKNEAQAMFQRGNPLHIQYGLMVVHDWFYDERHPLVTDEVLIETYKTLKEKSRQAWQENTTGGLADRIFKDIWPEIKKLIERTEDQMKDNEVLKDMIDNMEIDFDQMGGERTRDGNPAPLENLPEELQEDLRKKMQEKWDSLSDEKKQEILDRIKDEIKKSEDENNARMDPKIKVDKEDIEKIKEVFEKEDNNQKGLKESLEDSGKKAGSGAGIGHDDFLRREGITEKDYQFYNGFLDQVSGQAMTLRNYLRKIKHVEQKKRVRRYREEGDLDEDALALYSTGEYRVFKEVVKQKKMHFKISFLVDLSGSMHGQNRIEEAIKALIVLLETITEWPEDIIFEVAGYSNTDFIPISTYNQKDIKLKDKIRIIKDVHELGKGGTNAAGAVEEAMKRNVVGDKKFRRIVFLISDGEFLGGDVESIEEQIRQYPRIKLAALGLGESSQSIEDLSVGRWLPETGQIADEIYRIMDLEFRQQANGRHGYMQTKDPKALVTTKEMARDGSGEVDEAQSADVGGIDFNPDLIDLELKGENIEFNIDIDQDLGDIKIDGLVPIIINVTPVQSLPMLFGIKQKDLSSSGIG